MKKILFVCMAIATLCFCSCTSENEDFEATAPVIEPTSEVSRLTAQMRALHGDVSFRDVEEVYTRARGRGWSRMDGIKIVLADANGAVIGFKLGGGLIGSLTCAASSSAFKALWTYFKLQIAPSVNINNSLNTCGVQTNKTINDSIGYYHNLIEYTLFQQEPDLLSFSSMKLLNKADSVASCIIPDYSSLPSLPLVKKLRMSQRLNTLKNIDTDSSMSFIEYVDALEAAFPSEADEIEFMAQYIFDIYYANEDAEEYTRDIVWMIDHSDNEEDLSPLRSSLLIAYSSIQYNNNTIVPNE